MRPSPCKSCANDAQRRRYADNPQEQANRRTTYRMSKYRISDAEYQRLLDAQNHRCNICGEPEVRKVRGKLVLLSVDHDHETGKVRGLLCSKCNAMLGQANDDPNHLFAAIQYLDENGVSTRRGIPTTQEIFGAIQAISTRIDGTNERIDSAFGGQQGLSKQMTELHTSMNNLEKVTNERLHEMEGEIAVLKRPWTLIASGWSKTVALGGVAAALSGTIVRLELWRFIPGL